MAEGSETPNGEQGTGPEGRPRRSEGDLLAERRARRAAESGEVAITRRAEAAEATLQTLERHVASLQQRLREAEEERLRMDELLEAERAAALEREHELRRVKQREYAEQQLRVEAEERLLSLERESHVEIERLSSRLSVSEADARELARRLERVQRQLAEAGQEAAAERAAAPPDPRSAIERDLQARLSELERRALEIQRGLDSERAARGHSEQLLESMREGHRRMEALLVEMKEIVGRVTAALAAQQPPPERSEIDRSQIDRSQIGQQRPASAALADVRGAEMAEALAAAVERLRARAESAPPEPVEAAEPAETALDIGSERTQTGTPRPAHKHSESWIARRRIRRKQRLGR